MVLSVNGIPVVALELKNQLTGQDCSCAMNQYKSDRSSKEFAFRLNHRFLVYFAVDLYEVWMTTRLEDGNTRFMPFNQVQTVQVSAAVQATRSILMATAPAICGKKCCNVIACWT